MCKVNLLLRVGGVIKMQQFQIKTDFNVSLQPLHAPTARTGHQFQLLLANSRFIDFGRFSDSQAILVVDVNDCAKRQKSVNLLPRALALELK